MTHYEKDGHPTVIYKLRAKLVPILHNCSDKALTCKFADQTSDIGYGFGVGVGVGVGDQIP